MKIFDAHSDIWTDVPVQRLRGGGDVLNRRHMDRLGKGGVEGSIFVIWVDPPFDADPMARTRDIMDAIRAEMDESGAVTVVHSFDEMMAAREAGKFYVFIGIEGLAAIGEDLDLIDWYYDFGCRHAGLTWNEQNALATGVKGDPDRGLTAAGRAAVKKIQDKHMLLDMSHINEKSFWDVVKIASAPIAATHSNCRALCDVPRNLTDDQLRAIRDLGGVVGINSFRQFVDADPAKQNLDHIIRHAAHMIDVMGIDHVSCGFDFFEFLEEEAMSSMTSDPPAIAGLEDCSKIPDLIQRLKGLGLNQEELEKIAYRNFHDLIRRTIG